MVLNENGSHRPMFLNVQSPVIGTKPLGRFERCGLVGGTLLGVGFGVSLYLQLVDQMQLSATVPVPVYCHTPCVLKLEARPQLDTLF